MQLMREYRSDEEKVKVYDQRLRAAEKANQSWHPLAQELLERYENRPKVGQYTPKGHRVSVPDGTSIIDSLYAAMTAADVDVMVEAKGAGTSVQEDLATAALSAEWEDCKVNERMGPAIKDALIASIGWAKVSYEYYAEEQEVARTDEAIAAEVEQLFAEAKEYGHDLDFNAVAAQVPVTEVKEVVLEQRIVVDVVPWDCMLWDPTARSVRDIGWFAQVTKVPVEEVTENPVYRDYCRKAGTLKKLDELKGDATFDLDASDSRRRAGEEDDDDVRVTLYEVVNRETGTTCIKVKGADFLLDETPNAFAINDDAEDWAPFVPLVLRDSPGRVRGVSEMELMLPTLKELDLYHSRLATFIERFAPKVVADKGVFTQSGKQALKSQEYGAIAETEPNKSGDWKPFEPPVMPSEIYGVPDKLKQALFEATGVNELNRGMFPDRKRTATETAEVVNASSIRQAEKRVMLERFYTAIARRMLQLMQMFYTDDKLVRYMDWEGPVEWEWTADDIVFETKLSISLTPKEVRTRQSEREEGMALLNILGPLTQPDPTGVRMVDPISLYRTVLGKLGFSRREVAQLLPTAEEQQMQQLEQQQLAAANASASAGLPRPDMTPGPLDEEALAAAVNAGTIPPEILAAAGGTGPGAPGAVGTISEDLGVAGV